MARVLRGGHATNRVALIVIALGVACLGLSSTGALGAPNTSTTLPRSVVVAGDVYARHFLDAQPIPPEARRVATLPTPLPPNGDVVESPQVRQVHHFYLLPMSVSVDEYVHAHLLRGEKVTETGTGTSPNAYPTHNLGVSLTCVSLHITFCGIYYQTTEAKNGQQELRVDAQVIYLPIIHDRMPTNGTVTVTGYGRTSLMDASSDPTTVVLTHHQALTLRTVIAELKDFADESCMEDSQLLEIKIVKEGKVVWSAGADECPGVLAIASATANLTLDDHSCAFWHVVTTFFAPGTARATTAQSKECSASQFH